MTVPVIGLSTESDRSIFTLFTNHKILLEITDTTDAVFQPADGRLTSLVDIIVI